MSDPRDTTTFYGQYLSETEYLRVEESAKERHEYLAGRLFALTGSTIAHNELVSTLSNLLYGPVKASGCSVYTNDIKVKVETMGNFYYPDVVVTCEKRDPKSVFIVAPCLIIEVLSPSTKKIDQREKLIAYKLVPSVKEYLLVHQNKVKIEMNRKDGFGNWAVSIRKGFNHDPVIIAWWIAGYRHRLCLRWIELERLKRAFVKRFDKDIRMA